MTIGVLMEIESGNFHRFAVSNSMSRRQQEMQWHTPDDDEESRRKFGGRNGFGVKLTVHRPPPTPDYEDMLLAEQAESQAKLRQIFYDVLRHPL